MSLPLDPADPSLDEAILGLVAGLPPLQRRAIVARLIAALTTEKVERPPEAASATERDTRSPVSDEAFVRNAYQRVLGRAADDGGLRHYSRSLAGGASRVEVVRALIGSDEFAARQAPVPRDTQLCELANPAKWDNEEWTALLRSLGLSDDKLLMHRKPYEFTQLIYGCRRLGLVRDDADYLSVGAGHEQVLYWLANHVRRVVGTDLYSDWEQAQAREGDPGVLRNPEAYAPFPYRRDRLIFLRMNGRRLAFDAGTFDVVYSLSSIEHFGGMAGAVETLDGMVRVLRPGGVLALATEYVLDGPPHDETFQPGEFRQLIDRSDLELVEPIDVDVYRRYATTPVDLHVNPYQTPHMLVRFGGTVFTSVMAFLRKR